MAGIYIHIPFCKQRCSYCDFYSSTQSQMMKRYVKAVCKELKDRKSYLNRRYSIGTVYFGGGTPSLLSTDNLAILLLGVHLFYNVDDNCEQTLEANPDDLTSGYVESIKDIGFNRISLGIQSFDDQELQLLNRRHDAQSAIRAVKLAQQAGFENISIDLMYGLPGQTEESWKRTLQQAIDLQVQHISAYHLTYEKGTPLYKQLKRGSFTPADEELSNRLFDILIDTLTVAGFEHYEISNFARPGFQSRHNASYWNGTHYLGIGASAHSYNGISRQWNKNKLTNYSPTSDDIEWIDKKTAYNDFVITRLRTMKGMGLKELVKLFDESKKTYCLQQAQKYIVNGLLQCEDNYLRLTRKGIFISDGIMSDLME